MRSLLASLACTSLLTLAGTSHAQPAGKPADQGGNLAPGQAKGSQQTDPRQGPNPTGAPVEQAPPNVPEFKPAFPGQTRAPAVNTRTALQVTEVAAGFNKPWAIAFLPDKRMLVTEKPTGKLFIVTPEGKKSPAIAGLPKVDGRNQGGLLDVEVGPDYGTSGLIYWTYYEPRKGGNGLAVARAKLVDGPKPKVEGVKVIFRMEPTLESTLHAGGRLVFTPDGKLFVTLGERSIMEGRVQARDLKSDFGKIVRINPDGSIPKDNPFVGQKDARPEIWTLGHRNILSAALDSKGRLWEVEMGPRGGDELNLIERGKDYGWPTIGYGEEYSGEPIHKTTQGPGMEQPVYYWDPVISPSGMTIYSGELFPEWKGNFFIGGLSSTALVRLVLENDRVVGEERLLMDQKARIREVVQGPEGALYLLTDDSNGKLLKVTPR
ncbi:PQQ-dependent sugar dehydrogenase [Myxococcus sp. K38C18041901]|uniref:PQQ-dependent sugar dehydrogenase n=1 Tax=Myxococcus guangdongensis TaxID=2906760 RepID=UPI0020A7C413|nr:PQQ-dependent sugar dehydrogenase [Myxococcus guangdongensis]MCP3057485.1 PQQ-dependent sugar dehydrogenase [Myxococcus guangdongensis]